MKLLLLLSLLFLRCTESSSSRFSPLKAHFSSLRPPDLVDTLYYRMALRAAQLACTGCCTLIAIRSLWLFSLPPESHGHCLLSGLCPKPLKRLAFYCIGSGLNPRNSIRGQSPVKFRVGRCPLRAHCSSSVTANR